VVSVVEDGPAFRAGVEARDTLIAVDGKSLATTEGRSALQDLSAGKPVLLSLAGPSGRREVSVTPEVRSDAGTMRFQWSVPAPDGAEEGVQVFRFPAPKVVEELEIRLDSIQGAGAGSSFVLIEPDSAGGLQVKVGDSKSLKFRARAPDSGSESEGAWIVRSPDLAQRLETVRDRTLEVARLQLDSLARLHEGVVLAPMPEFGRGRVAGAELRQMTPELAEYFEGREQGLLVLRVIPDTPASRLGLRGGDVVIEANGTPLGTSGELREQILRGADRGTTVKWIRKGTEMSGILRTR
jgi:membrane-associated protease RseP (regulator of RpoE activity)